jgi:hypothetical protein
MLFAPRGRAKMSDVVLTLAAAPAFAESPAPAPQASADAGTTSITLDTIEIISQELNAARWQIQPSLGASTYTFSPEALGQGENAPLNQVLLQMPGVAQDSFGQIHVRSEHAVCSSGSTAWNCQRVSVLDGARNPLARSVSLIPAPCQQYGFLPLVLDIRQDRTHQSRFGSPCMGKLQLAGAELRIWQTRRSGGLVLHRDHLSNERGIGNPAPSTMQCTRRNKSTVFPTCRHYRSRHA